MHAFPKKKNSLNTCQSALTGIAYLAKLISSIDRTHDHRNGIWFYPVCLVILSAYGSIYFNVKGYKTQIKTLIVIEYEWEKMLTASISTVMLCSKQEFGWWHISIVSYDVRNHDVRNTSCTVRLWWMILHARLWSVKVHAICQGVPNLWNFSFFEASFWRCVLNAEVHRSPEIMTLCRIMNLSPYAMVSCRMINIFRVLYNIIACLVHPLFLLCVQWNRPLVLHL